MEEIAQKITVYDIFSFETRMREIVDKFMLPIDKQTADDRERVLYTQK